MDPKHSLLSLMALANVPMKDFRKDLVAGNPDAEEYLISQVPSEIAILMKALDGHTDDGFGEFWLVGGCIRDLLLGRKPKDWDMVTTTPRVVEGLYPQVGKDFPVWQARLMEHTVEIAAARKEKKVAEGHTGFTWEATRDIQEDLLRRDLTINAIAMRRDGSLTYVPGAMEDLENGILRHVTSAFAEDPLRVFRVARFAAQLGFTVHPHTTRLMFLLRHELGTLSKERVRIELEKALMARFPSAFFRVLRDARCLDTWFPEVENLIGSLHGELKHPEGDAFEHTMLCLDTMCNMPGCAVTLDHMLAILGHDFGKAHTDPAKWPKHIGHEELGVPPIERFCDRLGYGRQVIHTMSFVAKEHMKMHLVHTLRPVTLRRLVLAARRTVLGIKGFGDVCQADHNGRGGFDGLPYPCTGFLLGADEAVRSVIIPQGMDPRRIEQAHILALKDYKAQDVTQAYLD
jgi:tRNA nucleotidyltransferase (CCA-adding enzyme)